MWKRLIDALEIPFDPADESSNRENVISSLINLFILVLGLYLVPVIIERGFLSQQSIIILAMIGLMALLRVSLHKFGAKPVSIFLVIINWFFINGIFLFYENGLRAPTYLVALAFLIVYVGILYGKTTVIIVTVLSILTGITVGILENQGVYLTQPRIPTIEWAMIALVVVIPIIAFMVSRTLQNLKQSIVMYREEAEKRLQSELEIKKLNRELEKAYATTLEGWARALELRDKETEGHSRRVMKLTIELGKKLGMSDLELKYLYYGAMLHDIGKMGIPDSILKKPSPLTPEEWAIIKQHPTYAYELLKDIEYLQPALGIPYSHHENWDGSGYPQGLKNEEIPLPARIFAVVDKWDALTTDRPYRSAWPQEKVIEYIRDNSGKLFDPCVADVFLTNVVSELTDVRAV